MIKQDLEKSHGYLMEVQCPDRIRLHGFLQCDGTPNSESMLWIIIHGVAGNFYAPTLLSDISDALREIGHATLRINTRGHDQIAFASGSWPYLVGSSFEKIKDSYEDIGAWIKAASQWGFERIGIIGHSLGAIKAGYYAKHASTAQGIDPALDRLILISPPRLNHETLKSDPKYGRTYQEDLARAEQLVLAGDSDRLLQIKFPQPLVISAGTYLDKYGKANEYDYLRWADKISAAHWIFGSLEVRGTRLNFANCDKLLQKTIQNRPRHTIDVIEDGDHNYTEARAVLSSRLKELALASPA